MPVTSEMSGPRADDVRSSVLDSANLREAFGTFATGITVVTGFDADDPVGFTCQSFHSVSLEPPLVSIGIMKTSTSYPRMRARGRFAVNLLSARQQPLAAQFARRDVDKWAGVEWSPSALGNPVLADALATVDCQVWNEYDVGDHLLVIGQVVDIHRPAQITEDPLVYYRSRYRLLAGE